MNKKTFVFPAFLLLAMIAFSAKASAESLTQSIGVSAQEGSSSSAAVHTDLNAHADGSATVQQSDEAHMTAHPGMPVRPMPVVYGTVTAINGNTITIQVAAHGQDAAKTITVDASTAVIDKNKTLSAVSGIAVGDTVLAEGTLNGTALTATRIHDGVTGRGRGQLNVTTNDKTDAEGVIFPEGNGQPIVGGTVSAVNGNTVTITNKSNVSYTIDISNAKITKNGSASAAANVAVGDNLLAQGTINGTSVTAVNIVDSASASSSANAHVGFLGAIGSFFARLFGFHK